MSQSTWKMVGRNICHSLVHFTNNANGNMKMKFQISLNASKEKELFEKYLGLCPIVFPRNECSFKARYQLERNPSVIIPALFSPVSHFKYVLACLKRSFPQSLAPLPSTPKMVSSE